MITPFPLNYRLDLCPHCDRPRSAAEPVRRPDPVEGAGAREGFDFLAELRRDFRYDPGVEPAPAEAVGP